MQSLFTGTLLLLLLLALVQLAIWAASAYFKRQDNNRTRDFLEVQLLAEAEALRAATRIRQVQQVNLRG